MSALSSKIFLFSILLCGVCIFPFGKAEASDSVGAIDPSYKYAWGENLGWLNFGCDNCNVQITDTGITGYTWSRQYGWLG